MLIINDKKYDCKRLHRLQEIAAAMLDKPYSSFLHFTFLCNKSKIISLGWNDVSDNCSWIGNRLITYPQGGRHSETHAIRKLDNLEFCKDLTLINIRLNHKKELRNAYPCEVCLPIIRSLGFKRFYYSTNEGIQMGD